MRLNEFAMSMIACILLLTGCAGVGPNLHADRLRKPASVPSACGDLQTPIKKESIPCLTQELIKLKFPELEKAWSEGRIGFREFHSSDYFLKANFIKGWLSSQTDHRKYAIDFNPKLFDLEQGPAGPPSAFAIQGILAHELIHVLDYETHSVVEVGQLILELGLEPAVRERATDLRAFERGYARGIRDYRIWIYGKLSPEALKLKKYRYYTPEEIDQWLQAQENQ